MKTIAVLKIKGTNIIVHRFTSGLKRVSKPYNPNFRVIATLFNKSPSYINKIIADENAIKYKGEFAKKVRNLYTEYTKNNTILIKDLIKN